MLFLPLCHHCCWCWCHSGGGCAPCGGDVAAVLARRAEVALWQFLHTMQRWHCSSSCVPCIGGVAVALARCKGWWWWWWTCVWQWVGGGGNGLVCCKVEVEVATGT
ncbi:hypothetical protein EDB85DRAFT_1899467 [Lactarius pseudohatsudake]|nr:hypothetical protein EDB85DRAFT_1899467 [Lactarius pseudohatsudake]